MSAGSGPLGRGICTGGGRLPGGQCWHLAWPGNLQPASGCWLGGRLAWPRVTPHGQPVAGGTPCRRPVARGGVSARAGAASLVASSHSVRPFYGLTPWRRQSNIIWVKALPGSLRRADDGGKLFVIHLLGGVVEDLFAACVAGPALGRKSISCAPSIVVGICECHLLHGGFVEALLLSSAPSPELCGDVSTCASFQPSFWSVQHGVWCRRTVIRFLTANTLPLALRWILCR